MKKTRMSIMIVFGMVLAAFPCRAEVTTQMVHSAEIIVVGHFGIVTSTGSANAHINVGEVLKGDLAQGKELVVVFWTPQSDVDFKAKHLFFLKKFEVKDAEATRKYQWMQFLDKNLYGLEQATDQNLAQVKRLLSDSEKKTK
jgi:hypothetical protein